MGRLTIITRRGEAFQDREDAGRLLAGHLSEFQDGGTVVLGIPRGGVVTARAIAERLNAELDVVLSRKIGAPHNPELAIGAVSENGDLFINEEIASYSGAIKDYIDSEKERQLEEIRRRAVLYRKDLPKVGVEGKVAVVTDDGIATGATMKTALMALRRENPSKLIAAIPVGPGDTLEGLAEDADELIALRAPGGFFAVGQFYLHFDQVDDQTVREVLKEYRKRGGANSE